MNGQAGKGSKPRPFSVPLDTYGDRFDAIDWSKKLDRLFDQPTGRILTDEYGAQVKWVIPDLKDLLPPQP